MLSIRSRSRPNVSSGKSSKRQRRYLDLSSDDISGQIIECMDLPAIVRASDIAQKAAPADIIGWPRCVYVLGPCEANAEYHKIGVTRDPLYRLSYLQIGNWHKLEIKSLLWSPDATCLEAAAHNLSKAIGDNTTGEWVKLDAVSATGLALTAAKMQGIRVMSSAGYLEGLECALMG